MPCYHPLEGWRGRKPAPSGKTPVVWRKEDSCGIEVQLPCGQCIGCRLERTRSWAVRMMHEASLHEENVFLTLTYNEEHAPEDGSLNKAHFQDFMKRLRWHVGPVRFFHCGEYGDDLARPHYHACIFGFGFPDKRRLHGGSGPRLFRSDLLERLWPFGFSTIGAVNFDSAAYVARYCVKKLNGDEAESHYLRMNPATGELTKVEPEYATMSRRPGIAADWFEKFGDQVYEWDSVIVKGKEQKPPKYYDKLFEAAHGDIKEVKDRRLQAVLEGAENFGPERLAVKEKVAKARLSLRRGKI